jgi:diguanylate cyclase (GGDEF)-like protein/PAS domain S-box-containing protein
MTDLPEKTALRLLIVEDSPDDAEILLWELQRGGFEVQWERVDTAIDMAESLDRQQWDIIIADYVMPRFTGMAALELLKGKGLDIPFVIVSGRVGEDIAVDAMRAGASDYLLKGHLARLGPVVRRELAEWLVRRERQEAEKERALLKQAIDKLPLGLTITDMNRHIIYTNPAEAAMHGYSVAELIGQSVRIMAPPGTWLDFPLGNLATDSVLSRESMNMRKDGSLFLTHMVSNVVTEGDDQHPVAMISICEDITERKEMEMALRRQMTAIESAMDGIIIVGSDGRFTYVNQACATIYGHNLATDFIGERWEMLFADADHARLNGEISLRVRERGNWRGELLGCRRNNVHFPLEVTITLVEDNGYVCVLRDISERKLTDERLRYMSTHDSLTGFYNRAYVEGELDRLDRSRQFPVSVIVADVDCLKKVNDNHGHAAGDELIRLAAQGIAGAFRAEDMVARFGGDEFIVLLPEANEEVAIRAMDRIRANIAAINQQPRAFSVGLSLGAATADTPGTLDESVRCADKRMYADKHAKRCGRDDTASAD